VKEETKEESVNEETSEDSVNEERTISPKILLLIVIVLTILIYLKYEQNQEKVNQQLLQEVMKKPIWQIERELSPEFVKKMSE
jgi:sensor domain CHASE-containing protein